jgi:hypothetical protein
MLITISDFITSAESCCFVSIVSKSLFYMQMSIVVTKLWNGWHYMCVYQDLCGTSTPWLFIITAHWGNNRCAHDKICNDSQSGTLSGCSKTSKRQSNGPQRELGLWMLHHNIREFQTKHSIPLVLHTRHSLNLACSEFPCSTTWKVLKGKIFQKVTEIIQRHNNQTSSNKNTKSASKSRD